MTLDAFNIACGFISIMAFAFSVYSHYKGESKRAIEAAKAAMTNERMRHLSATLAKALYAADMIVQIPKVKETNVEELQNIARLLRAELKLTISELDIESEKLSNWEFGKVYMSSMPKDVQQG